MGRKKLPANPRYKQQVKTFTDRYGRQGYKQAGSIGGRKSPTKFTSESARAASKKSWELRRKRQADAERKNGNENGLSRDQEN